MVTLPVIGIVALILFLMWRTGYAPGGAVVVCIICGVMLSGTAVGTAVHQLVNALAHTSQK